MKRLFALFLAFVFVSCSTIVRQDSQTESPVRKKQSDRYQIIVLGDLHYDNPVYHTEEKMEKRRNEITRNMNHWKKLGTAPAIIAAAADATTDETLFAVQLGDITQGDAMSKDAQKSLFAEALEAVATPFAEKECPLFVVKGNHDFRSPGEGEAFEETVIPFIAAELPENSCISGCNYSFSHGNDLFVFVDCEKPDFEFIMQSVASCPNLRHLFVFDHLTVLPYQLNGGMWFLFGERQGKLQAYRDDFRKLLAAHDAIAMTGHVHYNSLAVFENPQEGRIIQTTTSSMLAKNEDFPPFTDMVFELNPDANRAVLDNYIPFLTTFKRTDDGGYAVMTIDGDEVSIDYYHQNNPTPSFTWKLK